MYWTHPYQRYSNRYSKFFIIPHKLSVEECYSALAPYQGNVFLHWLGIRGKSFCFFWLSVMRNSFCVGTFFLRWLILSALTQCMGKVTSIRWHMTHSQILIICSFCDVFLTEAFGIPHSWMKNQWPWQDSNLQSPDPKSGALSIRPQGHTYTCV